MESEEWSVRQFWSLACSVCLTLSHSLARSVSLSLPPWWVQALQMGVYDHIPDDGRELVVAEPASVTVLHARPILPDLGPSPVSFGTPFCQVWAPFQRPHSGRRTRAGGGRACVCHGNSRTPHFSRFGPLSCQFWAPFLPNLGPFSATTFRATSW